MRDKLAVGLGLCVLLLAWLWRAGCAPPDYSRPGQEGRLPRNAVITRQVEQSGPPLPETLACGRTYTIAATARQAVVTCETFNYEPLYRRALENVQWRLSEIRCPEECPRQATWIVGRKWDCFPSGSAFVVFASAKVTVRCLESDEAAPTGLGEAPGGAFQAPYEAFGPGERFETFQGADELLFEEIGDDVDVLCPAEELARVRYHEVAPACTGLDYQPLVEHATRQAEAYHAYMRCQEPCQKEPFVVLRREWDCSPDTRLVDISVYFRIRCTRPR